jgi:hypothetical protein
MRALLVGLWKEARDQRAVLIAVLVALPVLVLGAAWAFGDQVPPHQFSTVALFVLPASLALFLIAVASELFGGERRRGTLDFARRLPRGLARSLGAKLLAYVLGSALFLAWGWCVAYVTCLAFGGPHAPGELMRLTFDTPDPVVGLIVLGLLCLGFWVLLVSTWIPQGGAAVLGAGLLLGVIALPAFLRLKESRWLLAELQPRRPSDLLLPLGVLSAAAVLALLVSYLRGNRRLASAWAPAWRGLVLLAVMATGAYAAGASALERALTIDPHDPGFVIQQGCVATGGRYAYLNVQRSGSARWVGETGQPTTPSQPWIVDLETGASRRAGEYGETWYFDHHARHAPQPIVRRQMGAGDAFGWYDAPTATLRKTLPFLVRSREVGGWEREAMATMAWHKDAEGRAMWFEGDQLVREGDPLPKETSYRVQWKVYPHPIPGGWNFYTWQRGQPDPTFETIEAETGTRRTAPTSARRGSLAYLSPRWLLVQRKRDPKVRTLVDLAVVDLDDPTGEPRPVEAPPGVEWLTDSSGAPAIKVGETGASLLLMTGTDPDERRLVRWAPLTGEVREIKLDGRPIVGHYSDSLARVPGGRSVIRVQRYRITNDGSKPYEVRHVLLDADSDEAQPLRVEGHVMAVLAVFPDGSVVGVEEQRRVVRYGPEPGTRTVLFPR